MNKETIETFTVEKYKKMKAGNATDGVIISQLGTYPAKFTAWKRENGLMEDKTVVNTPAKSQEIVQQVETSKETNSSSEDWEAKYEALKRELIVAENKYNNLLEARNHLFDTVNELQPKADQYTALKQNHDDVWTKLQSVQLENDELQKELVSTKKSHAYNQQAEADYRQLRSMYHALEEELAALQDVKRLSVLLASQYVAASREVGV